MAADTLCVCPMATWLWVCRSVIIIIIIGQLQGSTTTLINAHEHCILRVRVPDSEDVDKRTAMIEPQSHKTL